MKNIIKENISIFIAGTLYFLVCRLIGITCPIKAIFGYNCPTCGMTRALLSLLSGDLKMYFTYNPMALPCFFAFFWLIHRNIFHYKNFFDILCIVILIMNLILYFSANIFKNSILFFSLL